MPGRGMPVVYGLQITKVTNYFPFHTNFYKYTFLFLFILSDQYLPPVLLLFRDFENI